MLPEPMLEFSVLEDIAMGICSADGKPLVTNPSSTCTVNHTHLASGRNQTKSCATMQTAGGGSTSKQESHLRDDLLTADQDYTPVDLPADLPASGVLGTSRARDAGSPQTVTNTARSQLAGLNGWRWEVAVSYVDILSDICLHGSTSSIQKLALLGRNGDAQLVHKSSAIARHPLHSAGLIDLAFFHAYSHSVDKSGPDDWSWRVRYTALQGLVKVCRGTVTDPLKDGLRTIAWNVLMKSSSLECDTRVLEAIKAIPVNADSSLDNPLASQLRIQPRTLGTKIAISLSSLYLPPLPPAVLPLPAATRPSPRQQKGTLNKHIPMDVTGVSTRQPAAASSDKRSSLTTLTSRPVRQQHTTSFENRTSKDLMKIIAEQWQKELEQSEPEANKQEVVDSKVKLC
jgi:hypothetical protein